MRADENAAVAVAVQPGGSAYAAAMARIDVFGSRSAAASAASAGAASASVRPPSGTSSTTSMRSSVSVPVLSAQTTSTRARPSTAPSSWTRQPWRPSRTTPTAKATLVSSTRPSGIMAMTPATVPLMASAVDSFWISWVTASRIEIGISAHVM